jgi:predicted O-methyltransferase YrrM
LNIPFSIKFLGFEMQQHPHALSAFSVLFENIFPARIIEIGTSIGGLSVFLALVAPTITCDIIDYRMYRNIHNALGIDFRLGNVFDHVQEMGALIKQPGITVLLCDGGNKPREFNTFSKFLKPGDVIMGHDYSVNPAIWAFSEIRLEDVAATVSSENLEPCMQEMWDQAAWLCYRKK